MGPLVRFDDITGDSAFTMTGLQRVVRADVSGDVVAAVADVEAAVANGFWAAGFVAYEAAAALDPSLRVHSGEPTSEPAGLPLIWFGVFSERSEAARLTARASRPAPYTVSGWTPSISREEFEEAFATIRSHIAAGDTYQVNHTFRLGAAFSGDPFELYRDLALSQRGAYAAFLDLGSHQILSASPELFFVREGDVLATKPMKGTIGRGRWSGEDEDRAAQLLASHKDRSENLIIVDLLRNDLGRIAEFGSVMVHRLFEIERYETVWQLTSTIAGTVPSKIGFVDVLRALFPCGSVTGAPKPRTMELIAGLESGPRGVYCGTIGYLAPPGTPGPSARFNVAIRTVTVDAVEGVAHYGVGGGITWDSDAADEYDESRAKAQVLVERRPEFDLLETMRYEPETGVLWRDRHLARMEDSARYFGFRWDRAAVVAQLDDFTASLVGGVWRVRLTLPRAGAPTVTATPLDDDAAAVVHLAIDQRPVSSTNVFLFHKTTYRREYEQRAAAHPEADDVVLVNERAELTESTVANLALEIGGTWFTPPLDAGCLPGVYRDVLLEEGRIEERVLTLADLAGADAVAVFNSVRLWRPARVSGAREDAIGTDRIGEPAG